MTVRSSISVKLLSKLFSSAFRTTSCRVIFLPILSTSSKLYIRTPKTVKISVNDGTKVAEIEDSRSCNAQGADEVLLGQLPILLPRVELDKQ
jgi:hypothetical protein